MSINVDAEREAVALMLYRWDCEGEEDYNPDTEPWEDRWWDDYLIEVERKDYRRRAMLLMDAMVQSLTVAWQALDSADEKLREIRAEIDSWSNRYQDDRVHEWDFSGKIRTILDRP